MRSQLECECRLLAGARDRHRAGRPAHVIDIEATLGEDCGEGFSTVMIYLYFGLEGDDPGACDVGDIGAAYHELDHVVPETDFDAGAAADAFRPLVASINNGMALRALN